MATEQGVSTALGLRFQSVMEDVVPPPRGRQEPGPERLDGPYKTHPGNNPEEEEGLPRCNGDLLMRSPALNSSWGHPPLLTPAPWDKASVVLTASSERMMSPGRKPANQLVPGRSGKPAEPLYRRLDSEGSDTNVRDAAVAMETQRLHFRQFSYQETSKPGEVCSQLWYFCHRWLKPERHSKEQILELLILEQFLAILPPEVQSWVKGNYPRSCAQAVAFAEDFLRRQKESEKWGDQVVYEETPENRLERTPSEPERKETLVEVKQEAKGVADCIGDGQSRETEESYLESSDLVEICRKEIGSHSLPGVEEGEEELPPDQAGSETNLGEDTEERLASHEDPNALGESLRPQNVLKGKQETTCRVCGKSFSRRTGLLAHERVHTGEKPYKCSHCGRSFRSKSTLVVHQRTHTGEKPYQCQECGKSFPVTTQLIEHERTHSGEKPYKCAECGQTFRQRSHLKNHQKIHTGVKPFKCSYCGKGFSISSDLIRHERAHTGEKPFQCPDCGKRFCNSSQVITHRRVHTGEKPYKCLECGKGFTVSQQLIRHQTVHTGEKPYQCLECGKTFSVSTLLAGHLRIHTGEKPYECSECGKCFRLRSTLITHLKTHPARKT
uniref:Uncharacterized protein n=1 Tax=Pogona vitticeps TaxID=103695 RepID=A0ABM5FGD8_9SAUR